ncbi:A/G-specific adenine glycosylase, partial [Campylobacter coli]
MQKQKIQNLQDKLLLWYDKNGRKNLPWRNLESKDCDERL